MALTGLLSGILSLVIYGFFIASITSETSLEKNLLEKASSTIGSDSHASLMATVPKLNYWRKSIVSS